MTPGHHLPVHQRPPVGARLGLAFVRYGHFDANPVPFPVPIPRPHHQFVSFDRQPIDLAPAGRDLSLLEQPLLPLARQFGCLTPCTGTS